jgi:hypothetical protein
MIATKSGEGEQNLMEDQRQAALHYSTRKVRQMHEDDDLACYN